MLTAFVYLKTKGRYMIVMLTVARRPLPVYDGETHIPHLIL